MNATAIGSVLAALLATFAALYTAKQARQGQDATAEREVQLSMLRLLSNEVEVLNRRITELRGRLNQAEDSVDAERTKRRDVESRLDELTESVDRLRAILATLPGAGDNPEVARLLKPFTGGGQQ